MQLARHPDRPYALDYIDLILNDAYEIHGDRAFRDDPAIVCFMGYLGEKTYSYRRTKRTWHKRKDR